MTTERTIKLVCWTCNGTFRMVRRRGQYPRHCPDCAEGRVRVRPLALAAEQAGLTGVEIRCDALGWHVAARSPIDSSHVRLVNEHDLRWLLIDIDRARAAGAR